MSRRLVQDGDARYVTRLFDAGVLCPFSQAPKDEASDRSS
jgi:hypothetical protein